MRKKKKIKKVKDKSIEKKAISIQLPNNDNNYKLFDFISKESKNIYNHYLFCFNVFNKFKDIIYRETIKKIILDNDKLNTKISFDIDIYIQEKLKYYYSFYSKNYGYYKKNNNLIYNFIKEQNVIVTNDNFNLILNNCLSKCMQIKGIRFNKNNYKLVFYDIIKNILISFYKRNFFHVKYAIMYKKPIKKELVIGKFIKHVKEGKLLFDNENLCQSKSYKILQKYINLVSEQNIIRKFSLSVLDKRFVYGDIIINIMDKAYESIGSYKKLRFSGHKANKPAYLKENERYIIPFYSRSFKIINDKIRLCLGKYVNDNYNEICKTNYEIKSSTKYKTIYINENKNPIEGSFLYYNIPKNIQNHNIKLIELIPLYDGYKYKMNITYDKKKEEIKTNNGEFISIDLGISNLMTIYDPLNCQYIIKGGEIISINEYYNKKVSEIKKQINKNNQYTSKKIRNLLIKRENRINNYFDNIVKKLHNLYNKKEKIIIGYNENWKKKVNIGKDNNRKFYQIPYKRLLKKLADKFGEEKIIEVGEQYTSKVDSLCGEEVKKHFTYKGKRISRGLFSSSKGKLINADLNGAINIMRNYYKNENVEFKLTNNKWLFNPEKLTINRKSIKKDHC